MKMLPYLETFVSVAELASFAQTARQADLSIAAVSKQISKLEQEVGIQLFRRTTRRVSLTEAGKLLYEQAQRILEEMDQARALVGNLHEEPKGALKLVSGRHFAMHFITPHLPEWVELYPEVRVELELAERMPDMHRESIDVLLGMSVSASGDCIQKRILTTRYVICAAPGYWESMPELTTPDQLRMHRYIAHSQRRPVDEVILAKGISVPVTPHILVNDADTMLSLALEGQGIVMLHHYVVAEALKERRLEERLGKAVRVDVPLWVAHREMRFVPAKVRRFVDFIDAKVSAERANW